MTVVSGFWNPQRLFVCKGFHSCLWLKRRAFQIRLPVYGGAGVLTLDWCNLAVIAEDNEFKNHKLEQTLKQKLKKERNLSLQNEMYKLQYKFNLEQLGKLEEAKSLLEINAVHS